jgi:hypothetical protein
VIVKPSVREARVAHQLCDAHAVETVLLEQPSCCLDYLAVIFRDSLFAQSHGAALP